MPRGRWMQLQFSYFRLRIQILRDYKTVVMLPQYVPTPKSRQSIRKSEPNEVGSGLTGLLGDPLDALVWLRLSTCVRSSSQFGGWEVKITPIICKCVRAFSFFTITTIEPMANCRCLLQAASAAAARCTDGHFNRTWGRRVPVCYLSLDLLHYLKRI